jgi:hypothetical protein
MLESVTGDVLLDELLDNLPEFRGRDVERERRPRGVGIWSNFSIELFLTSGALPVRRAGRRSAWRCMGAVLGSSMISVVTATSEASERTDSSSGRTDCNFV